MPSGLGAANAKNKIDVGGDAPSGTQNRPPSPLDRSSAIVIPPNGEADGLFGDWPRSFTMCPSGQFVWGFQLKSESDQGGGDDTALNAIRMYCSRSASSEIRSLEAPWGHQTYGPSFCSESQGPVFGFRMRLEPYRHSWDDTAAGNVRLFCRLGGELRLEPAAQWGDWTSIFLCPIGYAVSGFVTRVEPHQGSSDDTALNGLRLACSPYTP
ncbi:hypothetical protein [Mesorhizobium retamae]|uniref:hypothetical protein n=1 Tax=Mesorhizobium retamae TaxID=2912854 RepID=UPI003CCFEEA9